MKQIRPQFIANLEYDLDGLTLEDAISALQQRLVKAKEQYPDFKSFNIDYTSDYNGDYSGEVHSRLCLVGMREETDAEYAKRIATEKDRELRQNEYELQQYKQLKAKFEGK